MRLPAALSMLDRKLLRDLWEMKGQALAIAAVIAGGVTMFVAYLSNFDSLQRTLSQYYERQRFADVFASAERAPERLAARIAEIPGVVDACDSTRNMRGNLGVGTVDKFRFHFGYYRSARRV